MSIRSNNIRKRAFYAARINLQHFSIKFRNSNYLLHLIKIAEIALVVAVKNGYWQRHRFSSGYYFINNIRTIIRVRTHCLWNIFVGDVKVTSKISRRITTFGQAWTSRRTNKADEVEYAWHIEYIALIEEMWEENGDKHQRPIEQIITEAIYMTDNNTRNCSNHYRNICIAEPLFWAESSVSLNMKNELSILIKKKKRSISITFGNIFVRYA